MNQQKEHKNPKSPRIDQELVSRFLDLQEKTLINQGREFDLKQQELELKSYDLENQKQLADKNLDLLANDLKDQRQYKSKLLWQWIVFGVIFMIFLLVLAYFGKDEIIKMVLTFIVGALSGAGITTYRVKTNQDSQQSS